MDLSRVRDYYSYISERYAIYLRRQSGAPRPWSTDPIFQQYKFCNVFREHDRVTAWIRENWREPYADSPLLWFATCLARQINWPDTLAELGFPRPDWTPSYMEQILDRRQRQGLQVYTGAYMICGRLAQVTGLGSINRAMAQVVLGKLWENRHWLGPYFESGPSLEAATLQLSQFTGWSGFTAYEAVTDLRWTRYLSNAPDTRTWAHVGPGANRGLNRLSNRSTQTSKGRAQRLAEMRELLELAPEYLGPDFPALEMREIEHNLCEFDKYERVRLGEGSPRSTFNGGQP